jgi:hypothetical protein
MTPTVTEPLWRTRERATNREYLATKATRDAAGILRWRSNGNVPPEDVLVDGGLEPGDLLRHRAVRDAELDVFITAYKANRAKRTDDEVAEHAFELRAAFGRGKRVVNVITGERYTT